MIPGKHVQTHGKLETFKKLARVGSVTFQDKVENAKVERLRNVLPLQVPMVFKCSDVSY